MLKELKTVINEIRGRDQRSLALELAMEHCENLGSLVKTIGVGPTLLLIKSFSGKNIKVPDVTTFSTTLEAAAAAVESLEVPGMVLRKRYSVEALELANRLTPKLVEIEKARVELIQRMDALDTD